MIVWGITGNSHNASLAVFERKRRGLTAEPSLQLLFASESERWTGLKNDPDLCHRMVEFGRQFGNPEHVVWYERPFKKSVRQLWAGQGLLFRENNIKQYLKRYKIQTRISYSDHHYNHAAAGYYTSKYPEAVVLVLDSVGEWDTTSIWTGTNERLTREFSQGYPHSVGLWYSSMTQRVGLKPNEDEYILMGMAAYGDSDRFYRTIVDDFIKKWPDMTDPTIKFKHNLHQGCRWWRPDLVSQQDLFDIAAAVQRIYEEIFEYLIQYTVQFGIPNLIIAGGCALNCVANTLAYRYYNNVWIMPAPGDAGNAIGAVTGHYRQRIRWPGPYLGYDIKGEYPVEAIITELKKNGICGVAHGRAEFGPRSLGNRSLLADPRGPDIRDRVNSIKQRQEFRPFAPAILAEHAADYFDGPTGPYMQFTAYCRRPELYPAIVHADGTSRVQTVSESDNPGFRRLLEQWYAETGCPILLNTSLNIRGQPIVNDEIDARGFSQYYGVPVY
jgi:carbamoyltransferase